jgi:hypothetical protein
VSTGRGAFSRVKQPKKSGVVDPGINLRRYGYLICIVSGGRLSERFNVYGNMFMQTETDWNKNDQYDVKQFTF